MNAREHTYQAPTRYEGYENQCYYRAGKHCTMVILDATDDSATLEVFRFANSTSARLSIERGIAQMRIELDAPSLRALFNALGDALTDIDAVEAERERADSFDRISEEMRDAEADGGRSYVYHCHPDIHYVPADQVQAKAAELEAAGCKRYMVLREPELTGDGSGEPLPDIEDGRDDARSTRHDPSLEGQSS